MRISNYGGSFMQTEHLIIRYIKEEDFDGLFSVVSNNKISDDMEIISSPEKAQQLLLKMIEGINNKSQYTFALINKKDMCFAGFIQLSIVEQSCGELSCVMHPNYWNKGLGSEAMLIIERFALEKLKLTKLRGVCSLFNSACTSLFKNVLGFDYISTQLVNGKDYLFFEKKPKQQIQDDIYRIKLEQQLIKNKN